MQKKGAIELSIGTIVIIVLAMSMLILGMVLVKNIFSGATDITDMTIEQVRSQLMGTWGENKKLQLYPDSGRLKVSTGEERAFAVGIKNLLSGSESEEAQFRYEISVEEKGDCSVSEKDLEDLIVTGKEMSPTALGPGGDPVVRKVTLSLPESFPLCTFTYKVQAYHSGNKPYATDYMDITIK